MNTEIAITSKEMFIVVGSLIAFVLALIFIGRFLVHKRSYSGLTEKYKGKTFSSPLVGRNKYPDVDVFNFSSQFLLLGLALTMVIMVSAFGTTSYDKKVVIPDDAMEMEEDIEIEPPRSAEPPPPPPPPPPPVIAEVPNEAILEDEEDLEFVDQSIDDQTVVEAPVVEAPVKADIPPPPPPPPPPEPEVAEIFQVVEEMPRFPGCENIATKKEKYECATSKMLEFIYGNIQYPPVARENSIQGTVVVRFVVNENGKITDAEVVRDIGGNCGAEALRIINLMNSSGITWHSGKQRGKPVKVRMNLPVKFKLIT